MKIRISIPRNPFLSKKTEARATGVLESFFPLVTSTISTPCLPGTCVESDDADAQASVSSAQSRRPLNPAPAGRSDVEVAGWPSFQRNCLGAKSPSGSRSAGLGEGRWRRRDSNRSRCRGRGQSLTVDEGGQAVHHGWEIWEGSLGAPRGRGRGDGLGRGGTEGQAWGAQPASQGAGCWGLQSSWLFTSVRGLCLEPSLPVSPRRQGWVTVGRWTFPLPPRTQRRLLGGAGMRSLATCQSQVR